MSNQNLVLQEVDRLKKKIFNKNDYQINLLDFSIHVQKTWCSTMFILRLFLEHPKTSL